MGSFFIDVGCWLLDFRQSGGRGDGGEGWIYLELVRHELKARDEKRNVFIQNSPLITFQRHVKYVAFLVAD